jgi:glycosyltransferase involved in cell wall biosynthesis
VRNNKLLFIITDLGSFNNFIAELCFYLINNFEYEIHVICSPSKVISIKNKFDFTNKLQFHFVRIPRGFGLVQQLKSSRSLYKLIKEINPDLIHAHFTTGIFTTILYKKLKYDIWGTFHGLGYTVTKGIRREIFKIIEMLCFSRINKIIVLNTTDFELLKYTYGNKVIKGKSLGLGCDINKFNPDNFNSISRLNLKAQLNIESQIVLTFTGRYVYFKGFDIVIKMFLKLIHRHPQQFKLLLIGGIDPIHKTGLTVNEENTYFNHPDIINIGFTDEVEKYLSITDLFVFPSKKEGIPICITEALAMGVPVVTFDSRGCNELVLDKFNGSLVNNNISIDQSVESFISEIEKLILDKNLLNHLQNNCLKDREKLSRHNFILEQSKWYLNYFNS